MSAREIRRLDLNLVVERPNPTAVEREHPDQELLGTRLQQIETGCHAGTCVEHHDDGDRSHVVLEQHDLLRLPIVKDREVFPR